MEDKDGEDGTWARNYWYNHGKQKTEGSETAERSAGDAQAGPFWMCLRSARTWPDASESKIARGVVGESRQKMGPAAAVWWGSNPIPLSLNTP